MYQKIYRFVPPVLAISKIFQMFTILGFSWYNKKIKNVKNIVKNHIKKHIV